MVKIKNILKALPLVLFLFYYSGTVLFYHSHQINGVSIVHSHPFPLNKTSENHSHSTSELLTIQHLSQIILLATVFVSVLTVIERLIRVISQKSYSQKYQNKALLIRSLRAPPVF